MFRPALLAIAVVPAKQIDILHRAAICRPGQKVFGQLPERVTRAPFHERGPIRQGFSVEQEFVADGRNVVTEKCSVLSPAEILEGRCSREVAGEHVAAIQTSQPDACARGRNNEIRAVGHQAETQLCRLVEAPQDPRRTRHVNGRGILARAEAIQVVN